MFLMPQHVSGKAESGRGFRILGRGVPAHGMASYTVAEFAMIDIGSATAALAGMLVYATAADSLTALAGLMVAFAGVVTALMPYLLRRTSTAAAERRQDRQARQVRDVIAARLQLARTNAARINGQSVEIDRHSDVLMALVETLKRVDSEKDKVIQEDRRWMRAASVKFNIPLPDRFEARMFDGQLAMDLDDLAAYLTGQAPAPPVVQAAKAAREGSAEVIPLIPMDDTVDMPTLGGRADAATE